MQKRVVRGFGVGGGQPSAAGILSFLVCCAKLMVIILPENNDLFFFLKLAFNILPLASVPGIVDECRLCSDNGLKQALIEKHSLLNYISFFWKLF